MVHPGTRLQDTEAVSSPSSSIVIGQPERKSIDALCFSTAAMSVAGLAGEESAHRLDSDCRSSTSENSSIHAFEVMLWLC